MVFVPQSANWFLLFFLFQISSTSAFYADKGLEPTQQPKGNCVASAQDTPGLKGLRGDALDGGQTQLGLSEEDVDDIQSDKRRLGPALNIGRGRGQKVMVNGKRVSEERELGDRFFQVYGKSARGQSMNDGNQQLVQDYEESQAEVNKEQMGVNEEEDTSDVDRRNIGSAMNLIKVRKNNLFRGSPPAAASGDAFEEERERRRLGSAMNLKKVNDRVKSRPIRE